MAYYDISCPSCGGLHAQSKRTPKTCPECGNQQAIVERHDFTIDDRFRKERNNMLERMGE